MPTIEDLIDSLVMMVHNGAERDQWKTNFIFSVNNQTSFGRPLSDAQVKVVMKLLSQHKSGLAKEKNLDVKDIEYIIANPTYRKPVIPSKNIPREVRFVDENILAFRYKLDPVIVREIKNLKCGRFQKATFDRRYRIWLVPVVRGNVTDIQELITTHKFAYDMETYDLVMKVKQAFDHSGLPSIKYDEKTDDLKLQTNDTTMLTHLVKMVTQ